MFSRSAPVRPAVWRGDQLEIEVLGDRLAAGVDLEDLGAAGDVGRGDEHLAVEAAGAQQRRVELLQQVGGGDHDHVVGGGEAVHLDQQLVEGLGRTRGCRWSRRARLPTASSSSMKTIAARVLAGALEQPPDPGPSPGRRTSPRTTTPTGCRRPRPTHGRPPWPAASYRCRAARCSRIPLGTLAPTRAKALGIAQVVDDLAQLGLGLVDAGDVGPSRSGASARAGSSPAWSGGTLRLAMNTQQAAAGPPSGPAGKATAARGRRSWCWSSGSGRRRSSTWSTTWSTTWSAGVTAARIDTMGCPHHRPLPAITEPGATSGSGRSGVRPWRRAARPAAPRRR